MTAYDRLPDRMMGRKELPHEFRKCECGEETTHVVRVLMVKLEVRYNGKGEKSERQQEVDIDLPLCDDCYAFEVQERTRCKEAPARVVWSTEHDE